LVKLASHLKHQHEQLVLTLVKYLLGLGQHNVVVEATLHPFVVLVHFSFHVNLLLGFVLLLLEFFQSCLLPLGLDYLKASLLLESLFLLDSLDLFLG